MSLLQNRRLLLEKEVQARRRTLETSRQELSAAFHREIRPANLARKYGFKLVSGLSAFLVMRKIKNFIFSSKREEKFTRPREREEKHSSSLWSKMFWAWRMWKLASPLVLPVVGPHLKRKGMNIFKKFARDFAS